MYIVPSLIRKGSQTYYTLETNHNQQEIENWAKTQNNISLSNKRGTINKMPWL